MFFKLAKTNGNNACEIAKNAMDLQREDIKKRMQVVETVSAKLADAVKQTQEISSSLTEKVNRELKIAKKTLTSISSKLTDGMVMINCDGHITHMNRAASKILGVTEKESVGKFLDDIVVCMNVSYDESGAVIQKPILMHDFFSNLSSSIFEKLKTNPDDEKYLVCNSSLRNAIPFCVETELDAVLGVKVSCGDRELSLIVTLTVLDNDPECIQDVTYVFLFNDHK